jgi:hypothetical protein
MYRDR